MTATPGSPPHPHTAASSPASSRAPTTRRGRLAVLGPGLVLAATSVGAGDMVTSLAGAAGYGMALMWAIVVGVVLKYALTEGVGRLYLASGLTVIASLRATARWLPYAFFAFVLVIGLLYGAALSSVASLALSTLFPALPLRPFAVVIALASAGLVYVGRYALFERVMSGFMLAKFVGMVVLAVVTLVTMDDPSGLVSSLRPRLPEGDVLTVLALVGGFNALCYLLSDSLRGAPDAGVEQYMGQHPRRFRAGVLPLSRSRKAWEDFEPSPSRSRGIPGSGCSIDQRTVESDALNTSRVGTSPGS